MGPHKEHVSEENGMNQSEQYLETLSAHVLSLKQEARSLAAAADILAAAEASDRLIHVFGTEPAAASLITGLFFRPGALKQINPILDPSLDPAHGAYRSAMCLELDGLAPCILDYYEYVEAGEPILLLGSDPALPLFSQALVWAKRKGLRPIAVLSGDSASTPCDADVVLHTHGSYADTLVQAGGAAAGGEQAVLMAALLHALIIETLERLSDPAAHVWSGTHFVDIAENQAEIDRLLFRIRHL